MTEKARGLGIGRALLVAMARIAVDENYCRIDWTTDKRFYRLVGENLRKFAGR